MARPVIVTEYAQRGALNLMLDVHGRDEEAFEKRQTWKLHARHDSAETFLDWTLCFSPL